ncbi:MAG TPA: hypothetical protein VG942_06685 [Hyphomonadaceae bacterium]|nr:hypothetical protein [Hyphomonadaceae bacterium]
MIDVIVNMRDAVFAALVAWTGAADGTAAITPAKDKAATVATHGKPAPIEKPVEQPQPKLY